MTEQAGQARPARRSVTQRVLLLLLVAGVTLGALAAIRQIRLVALARPVAGRYYCLNDGMLYVFGEDGSLRAYIGEIEIISGNWRAAWIDERLSLKYEKNNINYYERVGYRLGSNGKVLYITQMDQQDLTMNRQNNP